MRSHVWEEALKFNRLQLMFLHGYNLVKFVMLSFNYLLGSINHAPGCI